MDTMNAIAAVQQLDASGQPLGEPAAVEVHVLVSQNGFIAGADGLRRALRLAAMVQVRGLFVGPLRILFRIDLADT